VTPVGEARLWYWQRVSAMVLALCVLVHLGTIVYAVRGGLTAGEILARTRGSVAFAAFYAIFIAACAVHVPIGLAAILEEWARLPRAIARYAAAAFAVLVLAAGLAALAAVIAP
jgi:fumarate reductase subunit C